MEAHMADIREAARRQNEREAAGRAELRERITFSEQQLIEADLQRDMQKAVRLALRNDAQALSQQVMDLDSMRRAGWPVNFTFTRDGIAYQVSTEVGNGQAVVHVEEIGQPEQLALEPVEEFA
jgi:hypothetical protein